ncbi:MAG: YwaF family protein [Oscillospiraceae bacterium]|nr:YwaF family protein [Oscillospiraceae bacterium]
MELWTSEHIMTLLPSLAVMLVIGFVLRLALKNKPVEVRIIPLQVLAVIIVLLEIGKQVLSLKQGYDLYHLPFHFCSLFIFSLPVMAFYRGKHCEVVRGVGAALCASLMLLMLIYPNLIYSAGNIREFFTNFFSFHTVAFHNVVMLAFVLIVALQLHAPAPKGEPKAAMLFTMGFCVVSATMAQLLKTNYANYYSCNIPPLEAVRLSLQDVLGYGVTQALYILIVSALNVLFVLGSYWVYRGARALLAEKKKETTV